jgi:hypothetical protein
VQGQLLVKGQPAAGALVILQPQGGGNPQEWAAGFPRAQVAADGSFDVETYGEKDGAPAGDYVVLVSWTSVDPQNEEASTPDRLGGRYSDASTSPLRAKVESRPTELAPIKLP